MSLCLSHILVPHYWKSHALAQIVSIPMGTNCAPLIADLFLFCYERDFMLLILILLKLLTPPPNIYMTYLILIILILNKW